MKTHWQDPGSSEIRSTQISGAQEALGKIEDALGLKVVSASNISLQEVYIADADRYRIFQVPSGYRNWVANPSPVIRKNGVQIGSGYELDYGGGAVIFNPRVTGSDVITADFTFVTGESLALQALGADLAAHATDPAPHPGHETPMGAQAKVDAHAERTDNPHQVKSDQVHIVNPDTGKRYVLAIQGGLLGLKEV